MLNLYSFTFFFLQTKKCQPYLRLICRSLRGLKQVEREVGKLLERRIRRDLDNDCMIASPIIPNGATLASHRRRRQLPNAETQ